MSFSLSRVQRKIKRYQKIRSSLSAARRTVEGSPGLSNARSAKPLPEGYEARLKALFPYSFALDFADFHHAFWQHIDSLDDVNPLPFIGIWFRGAGKSTNGETAAIDLASRGKRKYIWYVRETQDQADGNIQNIGDALEDETYASYYPEMAQREVGKYGNAKGWRRNRVRTAAGVIFDAIGLDTARRGARVKEQRPDLIILDDLDGKHDTLKTTEKKIETLTTSLLPAGSDNIAVIGLQNLIIPDGIFARLAKKELIDHMQFLPPETEPADFLMNRIVSGPYPAIYDAVVEQQENKFILTGGTPSWSAKGLAAQQKNIDTEGYSSWLKERQHIVKDLDGGMFSHYTFQHCHLEDVPELIEVRTYVDPAVTAKDGSDSQAIQIDGKGIDGRLYRLYSFEGVMSPSMKDTSVDPETTIIGLAIMKSLQWGSSEICFETNQGGDLWKGAFNQAWAKLLDLGKVKKETRKPTYAENKMSSADGPKRERWQQMLSEGYELGRIIHVYGTHETLERSLKRLPEFKPFDLADAAHGNWQKLLKGKEVQFF